MCGGFYTLTTINAVANELLLAGIVAPFGAALGGLDALAVQNGGGGTRWLALLLAHAGVRDGNFVTNRAGCGFCDASIDSLQRPRRF